MLQQEYYLHRKKLITTMSQTSREQAKNKMFKQNRLPLFLVARRPKVQT
jgi:hypothetical protein